MCLRAFSARFDETHIPDVSRLATFDPRFQRGRG